MDSLQNGDSLVMLWLVSWLTRYSLHRIVVTRALAFGKRNELRKDFVAQKYEVFRFESGQRVGGLRESIDRFLETLGVCRSPESST